MISPVLPPYTEPRKPTRRELRRIQRQIDRDTGEVETLTAGGAFGALGIGILCVAVTAAVLAIWLPFLIAVTFLGFLGFVLRWTIRIW